MKILTSKTIYLSTSPLMGGKGGDKKDYKKELNGKIMIKS